MYAKRDKMLSKKRKAIRKKVFEESRVESVPAIMRRNFNTQAITAKLVWLSSFNTGVASDWTSVYGLYNIATATNDWNNFKNSYAQMNILHVTVKIYTQFFANLAGTNRVYGLCYDTKDNTALASLSSVADHQQHLIVNSGISTWPVHVFKFKTKAIKAMPQSTSDTTESWGYIKGYANFSDFQSNVSIGYMEVRLTCVFSAQQ